MATPYVGEIRQFAGTFAPQDWALCNGAILNISENEVLFQLIGTTYGGNGSTTFALPNLQSRVAVHQGTYQGTPYVIGQAGGSETVTLNSNQIPSHTHTPLSSATGTNPSPTGVWATTNNSSQAYGAAPGAAGMNTKTIGAAGGSQPHNNIVPYLCITYIIALYGVYPSQS